MEMNQPWCFIIHGPVWNVKSRDTVLSVPPFTSFMEYLFFCFKFYSKIHYATLQLQPYTYTNCLELDLTPASDYYAFKSL